MRSTLLYLFVLGLVFSHLCCNQNHTESRQIAEVDQGYNKPQEIVFTNITNQSGLNFKHENGEYGAFHFPESFGPGAAFIDFDKDHLYDILLVGGGSWPKSPNQDVNALRMFKNQGNGMFLDVTRLVGLDGITTYGFGLAVADYDNDGDDDFYLANLEENMLFQNQEGKFMEVAREAGVGGGPKWSTSPIFFDADLDGWLDLFVGNYSIWDPQMDLDLWCSLDGHTDNYCAPSHYDGEIGMYFHNQGDGTFKEQTTSRGFSSQNTFPPMKTLGVAILDFDKNGFLDLVVANDTEPDLLFINTGNGFFEERGLRTGIAYGPEGRPQSGMGITVGEVHTDGYETVFIGNFSKESIGVYTNSKNGVFLENSARSGIREPSLQRLTFGLSLFDVDLDGDEDLFAANGHVFPGVEVKNPGTSFRQAQQLFINDGKGNFEDKAMVTRDFLNSSLLVARASAFADIDLDGDLDLLLTENNGPAYLLRNDTDPQYNYLRLLLRDNMKNTNAIGSIVTLYINGKVQRKRVRSAEGYLSQSEFNVTFGLGADSQIDSLFIDWLGGERDKHYNVESNHHYVVYRGTKSMESFTIN